MWLRNLRFISTIALVSAIVAPQLMGRSLAATVSTVAALAKETHFHGIATDPADPSRAYLATHHGLYILSLEGSARLISANRHDYMGFTPHPTDASVLYASGHPKSGGNLGFIASKDGGENWIKLSDGVGGPVDFHQMDVSKADPRVIYGVFKTIQRSADGGHTWKQIGAAPDGLIDLAASSVDADVLFAATRTGLLKSTDGGKTWQHAYLLKRPVTMVHVTGDGNVFAYVVGTGLVRTKEPSLNWQTISKPLGKSYILHLAVARGEGANSYAVTVNPKTRGQAVLMSRDGGVTWSELGNAKN